MSLAISSSIVTRPRGTLMPPSPDMNASTRSSRHSQTMAGYCVCIVSVRSGIPSSHKMRSTLTQPGIPPCRVATRRPPFRARLKSITAEAYIKHPNSELAVQPDTDCPSTRLPAPKRSHLGIGISLTHAASRELGPHQQLQVKIRKLPQRQNVLPGSGAYPTNVSTRSLHDVM